MIRRLLLLAGLLGLSSAHAETPWLARAFVPSSNSVHGEIRLLKRGDTACLQTLLYSKYLRRGLYEMAKKERTAWPEGWPCVDVSTQYLADLDTAKTDLLGAEDPTTNGVSAIKRMLIEFNFCPTGSWDAVGDMELAGPADAYEVTNPRLLVTRAAHPHYVSRAMLTMGEQGFGLNDDALEKLLEKAGWSYVAPPELPPAQRFVPR